MPQIGNDKQSMHHNTGKSRKTKRNRSQTSPLTGGSDAPNKRTKDNEIFSPNAFEVLDGYDSDNLIRNTTGATSHNTHVMKDDEVSDEDLILNRILKSIGNLTNRLDNYYVETKKKS